MRSKSKREGVYVYIQLTHSAVQQKLTQHCKAATLQSKLEKKDRNLETVGQYNILVKSIILLRSQIDWESLCLSVTKLFELSFLICKTGTTA